MSWLEHLPIELKCAILENVPDIHSLRNLVHASPDYHGAYLFARNTILTRVTFRELWTRDIDLSKTTALVQVCHARRDQPVSHEVKWVLRQLRRHETGLEELKTIRGAIILDIEQCYSLLTLGSVVWKPFICPDDETDLFQNYPDHHFTDQGYILQKDDRDREEAASDSRNMDAGWDAYYLDDVKEGSIPVHDRLILRYTEFYLFFPGQGQWWNLIS